MNEHTPLPWYILGPYPSVCIGSMIDSRCGGEHAESPRYEIVCYIWHDYITEASDERKANAEFICRAVNCHDELLAALKAMVVAYEGRSGDSVKDARDDRLQAWVDARKAIAKAEGTP